MNVQYRDDDATFESPFDEEESISEADIAYQILSESGKENPLFFKKLILEVIKRQNKTVQNEAAAISEIYTMINMDSRFQHIGDGIWGLTDWYPPENKRSRGNSKTAEKTTEKKSYSSGGRLKASVEDESDQRTTQLDLKKFGIN